MGESNHTTPSLKKMRSKIEELMPPGYPKPEHLSNQEARVPMKIVVHHTTEG